ncbi:MAG: hypothetical protein NTX49_05610 [Chlamydiae bacterium]|nr:hypothetical protein [Chlamydiota bacterium]
MRTFIFSVLTVFLFFSKGIASEPLSYRFADKRTLLTSSKGATYILISNASSFFALVENGKESVNSKYPVSSSLTEADPNDPEWEKMITTSISKMKGANNKFWIQFFAICALSLMAIVTLGAIFIKVKKRYFS